MLRLINLAFILCLIAPIVSAQETPKRFLTTQACDPVMKMSNLVISKYGEQPLFQGEGLVFAAPTGQPYRSSMMFFVNQDSGTWSLISLYPDGTACMVANGKNFKPYSGPLIPTKKDGK